ncbi:membrane protein [Glycomyces albus]
MEPETQTPAPRIVGVIVGLALIVGAITLAFAWPSANVGPDEVPIAVVGPPEAAAQVSAQLDDAEPDGFDVTEAADAERARDMIEHREVYAALEIDSDRVVLYTATAASPTVARLVTGVAEQVTLGRGVATGQEVRLVTEDVVALPEDDPNGIGLAASALPMAAGGLIIAALVSSAVRGSGRQALAAALAPPAVGATIAAILVYVLGSIEGDYWAVTAAISLTIYAASWAVLGLNKLLGRAGLVLGAVAIMLVGNPLSGLTSAPELLPAPWGEVGQYFTPGAGATALKSLAFFDGNGADTALIVLASWLAAGIVLFILGAVRQRAGTVGTVEKEPVTAEV